MSLEAIIQSIGYPAVFIFVAGECMGIPMPGETGLLIAAATAGGEGCGHHEAQRSEETCLTHVIHLSLSKH